MRRQTHLYRLRSIDGDLLYVGCTWNVWKRLHSHKHKEWWPQVWSVEVEPLGWPLAWNTEQHEIRTAPGRYNVTQRENARIAAETRRRHRPWRGLCAPEFNCATCERIRRRYAEKRAVA